MSGVLALPGPITSKRDMALLVWGSFLNVPYLWGGDDPLAGVDCSGLVNEGLKAVGLIPRQGDFTADALLRDVFCDRHRYPLLQDPELRHGCLVFWSVDGKPTGRIRHVEIVWTRADGDLITIGASGGGSKTVDRAEAIKSNAYVKWRRITPGWVAAVDPFQGR